MQVEITSIETLLLKLQLPWAGHVSRMDDHRPPKIALYGKLSTGHRDRGAPKKRYKDCLKKSLDSCHIDHYQWSTLAADREAWCSTYHPQGCFLLWAHPQGHTEGETTHEEKLKSTSIINSSNKSKPGLELQPLLPNWSITYWPYKSPVRLQSVWYKCSFIDQQTKLKPHI